MSAKILYEQPLNERIRSFLRLEHFFTQARHFIQGQSSYDTQASVETLLEIASILERNDVRGEVLKELDRQLVGLARLQDTPAVDRQRLDNTLAKITANVQVLQKSPSKIMQLEIRENEVLNSIRQRTAISAGTCGFDLPAYHYLLNQTLEFRKNLLSRWMTEFAPLQEGVELLLSMLRDSALFEVQTAESGFYQKSLDTQNPCQLLRIALPLHCGAYPEVSGNKHRVNIRLLGYTEQGRPKQIPQDQSFEICFCAI